jgi:hypothetical protein
MKGVLTEKCVLIHIFVFVQNQCGLIIMGVICRCHYFIKLIHFLVFIVLM